MYDNIYEDKIICNKIIKVQYDDYAMQIQDWVEWEMGKLKKEFEGKQFIPIHFEFSGDFDSYGEMQNQEIKISFYAENLRR